MRCRAHGNRSRHRSVERIASLVVIHGVLSQNSYAVDTINTEHVLDPCFVSKHSVKTSLTKEFNIPLTNYIETVSRIMILVFDSAIYKYFKRIRDDSWTKRESEKRLDKAAFIRTVSRSRHERSFTKSESENPTFFDPNVERIGLRRPADLLRLGNAPARMHREFAPIAPR